MIFNSFTYLLFLILVVVLYWKLPRLPRLVLLCSASVVFYGFWRFDFVILLFLSIVTDYSAALIIDKARKQIVRRIALYVSLSINLGLLGFFKYFYFIAENGVGLAHLLGVEVNTPTLKVLLPIGISFYTFQSMSYTIDVYRKFIKANRDFLLFANYVIFFPQLIAGPILRANEVLWQLDARPKFSPGDVTIGIQRIVFGLFLKVVLADNIAGIVDAGFSSDLTRLSALDVFTLAFLFGFQIYFDFAAYSHIALGTARLMGIRFPENFRYPYLATSPRDFWNRWHISLSSWIRDYLYLPLTGAKVEDRSTGGLAVAARPAAIGPRTTIALFLTWAIMGLWHGAAWAFVVWGLWHATLIALYRVSSGWLAGISESVRTIGGWCWTVPMVMLGWIPFRTQSITDTLTMWGHLLSPSRWTWLGLRENTYLVAAILMLLVLASPAIAHGVQRFKIPQRVLAVGQWVVLTFSMALVLIYLRPLNQFIYFQF